MKKFAGAEALFGGLAVWDALLNVELQDVVEAIECAAPTSQLVRDGYLVPVRCYAPERKRRIAPPAGLSIAPKRWAS